MELIEEFKFVAQVAPQIPIGPGPLGMRTVLEIVGGDVTGERIRGKVLGGADWALIGPDGFLRIDVRAQIETHDGANIYIQYHGLLEVSEHLQKVLEEDGSTQFGDQYCFTNPRLETGDERYSWVNTTFFVAQGRAIPGGVEYQVWRAA